MIEKWKDNSQKIYLNIENIIRENILFSIILIFIYIPLQTLSFITYPPHYAADSCRYISYSAKLLNDETKGVSVGRTYLWLHFFARKITGHSKSCNPNEIRKNVNKNIYYYSSADQLIIILQYLAGFLIMLLLYKIFLIISKDKSISALLTLIYPFNFFLFGFQNKILTETTSFLLLYFILFIELRYYTKSIYVNNNKFELFLLFTGIFLLLHLRIQYILVGLLIGLPFIFVKSIRKKVFIHLGIHLLFIVITCSHILYLNKRDAGEYTLNKLTYNTNLFNFVGSPIVYNNLPEKYQEIKDIYKAAAIKYSRNLKNLGVIPSWLIQKDIFKTNAFKDNKKLLKTIVIHMLLNQTLQYLQVVKYNFLKAINQYDYNYQNKFNKIKFSDLEYYLYRPLHFLVWRHHVFFYVCGTILSLILISLQFKKDPNRSIIFIALVIFINVNYLLVCMTDPIAIIRHKASIDIFTFSLPFLTLHFLINKFKNKSITNET